MEPEMPTIKSFSSDINCLSRVLHADVIRLLGGEPLLNPAITKFLAAAKASGIADQVMVTTNGLLLHRVDDEFWEHVDSILLNLYPGFELDKRLDRFQKQAQANGTQLWINPVSTFRTIVVTAPHPMDWVTRKIFETCADVHISHCHMIHEGKLYKCAVPPFLPRYLSKLGIDDYDPALDGFDFHNAVDLYSNLRDYLTSRQPMEACRYCLGSLGKSQHHQQIDKKYLSDPSLMHVTRDQHLDQRKLIGNLLMLGKINGCR
jgi:hypothetical protein